MSGRASETAQEARLSADYMSMLYGLFTLRQREQNTLDSGAIIKAAVSPALSSAQAEGMSVFIISSLQAEKVPFRQGWVKN